jgi:tetratricopeptide (TPR) repeat protein
MKEKNNEINFFLDAGKIFIICKNWKMAADAFSKVINSDSYDVMAYYHLGLSYLNLKRLTEAQQSFERVIELKTDFADAYFQLGLIEEKKKNWKRAQTFL